MLNELLPKFCPHTNLMADSIRLLARTTPCRVPPCRVPPCRVPPCSVPVRKRPDKHRGFDGPGSLHDDLQSGSVPNCSFIAPNQCADQHGRGNGTAFCAFDPNDNGTQAGLSPALMQQGDVSVRRIVTGIKDSPVWRQRKNGIVVLWDEDDHSISPTVNQVLLIVDTNYGSHG